MQHSSTTTRVTTRLKAAGQEGVALISALLLGVVALLLTAALFTYVTGSEPLARNTQDWNGSLQAAEAGVDDFLYRLTRDPEYWLYSASSPPSDGNQAFGQFVNIPGGSTEGKYKYKITKLPAATDKKVNLTLEVTGKVRDSTRTLRTNIRRRGFVDYLYFTEYEGLDPALASNPTTYEASCKWHWYGDPHPVTGVITYPAGTCSNIYFNSTDVIRGPLHSNDKIWLTGTPTFQNKVTTSWSTTAANKWGSSGTTTPTWGEGKPTFAQPLRMPESNSQLKTYADKFGGNTEGCLYTGPTRITLNADATMNVISPQTDATDVNPGCEPGSNRPLPENGVIYVQNKVASTSSPYYTAGCAMTGLGVPLANDITNSSSTDQYTCAKGDVFISGTLDGRLTVNAENRIIVVDDLVYESQASSATGDFLGLIANNFVEIFHPVQSCSSPSTTCKGGSGGPYGINLNVPWNANAPLSNIKVHAAILALNHSFRVQNYNRGAHLGNLTVFGAIAQQYRGIVTLISTTGYGKDYNYDNRLKVASPPHFLDPVQSSWLVGSWIERKNPSS